MVMLDPCSKLRTVHLTKMMRIGQCAFFATLYRSILRQSTWLPISSCIFSFGLITRKQNEVPSRL
jgi:hypothetical protein